RADTNTRIRLEARTPLAFAILDTEQRLVFLDCPAASLTRDGARRLLALRHELVAAERTDEGVVALVEMRQGHAHSKAELVVETVEFVPQHDRRDAATRVLGIDVLGNIRAEPAVDPHRRAPQKRVQPLVRAVEPGIGLRVGR